MPNNLTVVAGPDREVRGAGRGRVHGGGEEVRPDLPPRLVVHLQAARRQEAAQRRRRPQMIRLLLFNRGWSNLVVRSWLLLHRQPVDIECTEDQLMIASMRPTHVDELFLFNDDGQVVQNGWKSQ